MSIASVDGLRELYAQYLDDVDVQTARGKVKGCLAVSVDGDALIVAGIAVYQVCDFARAIVAF